MITPSGRYLGRKPDSPDPRDMRFVARGAPAASQAIPHCVDLRPKLPPAYDQGKLGACGPNAGSALMAFLFPEVTTVFSRLQIYYDVRVMEGNVGEDSGVETRDVLKTLCNSGAAPEREWPYDVSRFTLEPGTQAELDAGHYKLNSYSRLISEDDYLGCLASGFPFLLGIECFESIDGEELASSGVMKMPSPTEKLIGGHDVLVVGYDTNFQGAGQTYLLIRNSWGTDWGINGHFWMPIEYAINPSTGGDAWTGRRAERITMTNPTPVPVKPTLSQLGAAFTYARKAINGYPYGTWVPDAEIHTIIEGVAGVVLNTK